MYLIHVLSVLFENSFIILGRERAAEFSSKLDDFGLRLREKEGYLACHALLWHDTFVSGFSRFL